MTFEIRKNRIRVYFLGDGPTRASAYRALLVEPLDDKVLASIHDRLGQERGLGRLDPIT